MSQELLMKDLGQAFVTANPEPNKSYPQIPKQNQRPLELNPNIIEERTIELSVSSETPYLRWFGYEELDHCDNAVDLSRFNDGANVLFNHNRDDYIGIIEKAWLKGGKLYNRILFDTHELAEKIYQSIKSGIVRNVSIGYEIHELRLLGEKDNVDVYRAIKWTPLETSIVTVPADATVGIGRSYFFSSPGESDEKSKVESRKSKVFGENSEKLVLIEKDMPEPAIEINEKDIRQQERDRIAAITAAGSKYGCTEIATKAVADGLTLDQARKLMADQVLMKTQQPIAQPLQPLGFSKTETGKYSVRKAILYKMGQISAAEAGLEIEASRAIEQKVGKPAQGIYVPTRDLSWNTRATYATGAAATGGTTVETDLLAENFIEALRNQLVIKTLGATILSGLEGNVDIPRQASVSGTGWVGEGATITQFESTFDKITLTAKTVASRSIYTRNMLLQSSLDVENFIREDLVEGISLEIDRAAILGTGLAGQPLGIANYPGVNSVVIGVNGGAPTWQTIVNLETEVALDNALMGTCYYLTNSRVRGRLKTTEKAASTGQFVWENDGDMGNVNGYGAAVTNMIPGNLTKGTGTNLSMAIFGDFSALIVGEWGILDLLPNPYGTGYEQGNVQVRAMQSVDVNLRRPEFFSVCTDINTI